MTVTETVTAYRSWRLGGPGLLGQGKTVWKPHQTATARCLLHGHLHRAPVASCTCGIYACTELSDAARYVRSQTMCEPPGDRLLALGAVRFVGPLLPAPRYFVFQDPASTVRGSAAEIVGPLYLSPDTTSYPGLRAVISAHYGVPFIDPPAGADHHEWLEWLAGRTLTTATSAAATAGHREVISAA